MLRHQTVLTLFFLALVVYACNLPGSTPTQGAILPSATSSIIIQQNTPVYAPTATPIVYTPTPTVGPVFYTVLPGDTLLDIATRFDIDPDGLARANHLSDQNYIQAGQQLLIATAPITVPEATVLSGKQIIVVISSQRAYAFENEALAHPEFIVATGVANFPTVTGTYQIERKYEKTDMSGPGYYISDVPWTMYFYQGYGLHGAPWNNNLGKPGSHGCVNMSVEEAKWLYDWTPLGTSVLVLP